MLKRKLPSFRTKETEYSYYAFKMDSHASTDCVICAKNSIMIFKYWKIIENQFPYDRISTIHHMIVPIRHVRFGELSMDEISELEQIKRNEIDKVYECIIESTALTQSVPEHFHLHLLVLKEFDE